jgi:L-tryptophan--pyruvate aminotransferase
MKTLDLRIGDPAYMKEYWELIENLYQSQVGRSTINISQNMNYDYEQESGFLKEQIKMLHKMVGNAETEGYQIIIGNGISQLISAAAYAMRLKDVDRFFAQAPHWNRFNFLCNLGAKAAEPTKDFFFWDNAPAQGEPHIKSTELVTVPNNPDNLIEEHETTCTYAVHDLCYYWPQYTSIAKRTNGIMLFGLSKATGHAGSRIGWALVKNIEVASSMKKYITLSTSGVSLDAQFRAVEIIHSINVLRSKNMMSCFDCGKRELTKRWFDFLFATGNNSNFKVLNESGMFAWCEWLQPLKKLPCAEEFQNKYGIDVLDGTQFGSSGAYATKFRINLGCSKEDFAELIKRIQDVK